MKIYQGIRHDDGRCEVTVSDEGEKPRELSPRWDLAFHSPDGFNWGYGGSGPSQLALALAADVLQDDRRALMIYQALKAYVVVPLDHSPWQLTEGFIRNNVASIEAIMRSASPSEMMAEADRRRLKAL